MLVYPHILTFVAVAGCGRTGHLLYFSIGHTGHHGSTWSYYIPHIYTILYYTILYYTILYYTILYYTILYYTILYYTILYYTILYYTILYTTIYHYIPLVGRVTTGPLGWTGHHGSTWLDGSPRCHTVPTYVSWPCRTAPLSHGPRCRTLVILHSWTCGPHWV